MIVNQPTVSKRFHDATYKFIPTEYDQEGFDAIVTGTYGEHIPLAFDDKIEYRLLSKDVNYIRNDIFDAKPVGG